jgi:pyruvate decarboxylase
MVDTLVRKSKLPTFVTPVGKSLVNEVLENFCGVYSGDGSFDTVRDHVNSSDCVVSIGGLQSDYNTMGFTYRIPDQSLIDLHTDTSYVNGARFDVHLGGLLQSMISRMDPSKLKNPRVELARMRSSVLQTKDQYPTQIITQEYLWSKLSDWLQPNDILVTDTGTAYLGVWDTQLKRGMTSISQPMWSSIGYALPAAQGAAMAARELGSIQRIILFEGDGSFQMTAQSISDIVRHKLDMIIFLLNNDGYTIERWVHGMDAEYNDVPMWRYTEIPKAMGAGTNSVQTFKISTKEQMEQLWRDEKFANGKGLRVCDDQYFRSGS